MVLRCETMSLGKYSSIFYVLIIFNSRGCLEAAQISIPYSMYSRIFIRSSSIDVHLQSGYITGTPFTKGPLSVQAVVLLDRFQEIVP